MSVDLIAAALILAFVAVVVLGHVLVIAAIYRILREDYMRGRRTTTDPTIDIDAKRAAGAVSLSESLKPQRMHALGARWLLESARRRKNRDPEMRAASGFPQ